MILRAPAVAKENHSARSGLNPILPGYQRDARGPILLIARILLPTVVVVCSGLTAAVLGQDPMQHPDLPPNNSVEPAMVGTGMQPAWGVAVDEASNVFASNYRVRGGVGRITPDGSASLLFRLDQLAPVDDAQTLPMSLRLDSQERPIVADAAGRLLRLERDGSRADVLVDRFRAAKLRVVSYVALDRAGNIYFTESGEDLNANDGRLFVYQIRTQQTALLAEGLSAPSGLAVSPDQKSLYVAQRTKRSILAFQIVDQKLAERRTLIQLPTENQGEFLGGLFDPLGMACDKKGRLYVAMSSGKMINVIETPSGRLLRQYATGAVCADCHFDDTSLCVALPSKEAIFRLPLGVEGFRYWQ